jgi:hypothetical protein
MMQEKEVEKYLRREVESMGGMCLKFISPGNAGVPDRIVLLPGGRVWFIEIKTDKGRVRPLQRWWQRRLRDVGIPSLIIKGRTEAEVFITLLREGGGDAV